VDEVLVVVPAARQHCRQSFPEAAGHRRSGVWRHQVVELLPLAVQVTESQMHVRRCPVDCQELRRRLIPLQARLGRLLRRGAENPDHRAAALCRELRRE